MTKIIARRREGFTHDIEIGDHSMVIDEPTAAGGNDEGPSPTRVLAASLAACTAITVEMYADRKEWDVGQLEVEVELHADGPVPKSFDVTLHCPGTLDDEQLERILKIAAKCPVHKALSGNTEVTVTDHVVRSPA
ncbi:OsmC family protein [soil metagenome]